MAREEHTYQPGWGEKKHHHHHHHYEPNHKNRGMGGALRMRDKQAYVGLMLVIIGALAFGGYKLADLFAEEIRQMPKDNPSKEMKVDALGIRMVDEAEALREGDSIARELQLDTVRKTVLAEKHNVYRPPRKNTDWYINGNEWRSLKRSYKIWLRSNTEKPWVVAGVVLFVLFILFLVFYGIYKHVNIHGE